MTSRRSEKRTLKKCELSVESLTARIAPAGFHAGSLLVAGFGAQFDNGTGATGNHKGPKDSNGQQFLIRTLENRDITNFRIKGEKGNFGNHGSNHHAQPFLNLAVSNFNTNVVTSTPSTATTKLSVSNVVNPPVFILPPPPMLNPPAPTPTFIFPPRPMLNPPAPTEFPGNPAPSNAAPPAIFIVR